MTHSETHPDTRTAIVSREIAASTARLFDAWASAEALKQWFGPKPYPVTGAEVDFRVGGQFWMQMTGPDGQLGPRFGGSYLEIDRPRRLRFTNGFLHEPQHVMTTTVTFEERGASTLVTVHTVFNSDEMYQDHVGQGFTVGTGIGLDQLAGWLEGA